MAEADVGGGGGVGAPPADAWLQAWRAIAPQWEQIRAKVKVSGFAEWQCIRILSHEVPKFTQRWYYMCGNYSIQQQSEFDIIWASTRLIPIL